MQLQKDQGSTRDAGSVEVELKAPVPDLGRLSNRLVERGATPRGRRVEKDIYLAHPGRDFAETDEALRIRVAEDGVEVTYKGPKVTDDEDKTREEVTLKVDDAHVAKRLFGHLGFEEVATITKNRQVFHVNGLTVCLDQVERLGTYAEIEQVVGHQDVDMVLKRAKGLAKKLGLTDFERRSYLELLLEKDAVE